MVVQTETALERFTAPTRTVAVIDPDPRLRDSLGQALSRTYKVFAAADADIAIARLLIAPAAILVGAGAPNSRGRTAVRALRENPTFKDVPIVLCRALASNGRAIGPDNQPDAEITLPCTDAALLEVIGRLGNTAVEMNWQTLQPAPRAALTRSLALFKSLQTLINRDGRLDYDTVTEACAPVIDTVRQSAHADVFAGLRNHDDYHFVHSLRVATLLGLFGYTIGLDDPSLMTLASAGLLHDVGKAAVPKAVMNKTGKLAPDEMALARGHVVRTVIYLESHSNVPKAVVTIAGQHHERLDGSGYPDRLPADRINDLSRMAAIVDVFCALTERRPHRAALSPYQALEVMQETMRPQLDQNMTRLFSGMLLTAA